MRVTSDAIFSIMPSSITDSGLICALSARRVGSLEHEGELGGHDTYSLLGALSFLHGLPGSCCDSGGGWPRSLTLGTGEGGYIFSASRSTIGASSLGPHPSGL